MGWFSITEYHKAGKVPLDQPYIIKRSTRIHRMIEFLLASRLEINFQTLFVEDINIPLEYPY